MALNIFPMWHNYCCHPFPERFYHLNRNSTPCTQWRGTPHRPTAPRLHRPIQPHYWGDNCFSTLASMCLPSQGSSYKRSHAYPNGIFNPTLTPTFCGFVCLGHRSGSRWNFGGCLVDGRAHSFQREGAVVGSSAGTGLGLSVSLDLVSAPGQRCQWHTDHFCVSCWTGAVASKPYLAGASGVLQTIGLDFIEPFKNAFPMNKLTRDCAALRMEGALASLFN